jgi:hypothetical protein
LENIIGETRKKCDDGGMWDLQKKKLVEQSNRKTRGWKE